MYIYCVYIYAQEVANLWKKRANQEEENHEKVTILIVVIDPEY